MTDYSEREDPDREGCDPKPASATEAIRNRQLDTELEKRARHIKRAPSLMDQDEMICALLNEIDALRKDTRLTFYQREAVSSAIYPGHSTFKGDLRGVRPVADLDEAGQVARAYVALKLNGEAGEIAEHIGKSMRDDAGIITPVRRAALLKELGDVLWYVAALSTELGFTLSEVAEANLMKLADRKARGVLGGSGDNR